MGGAWGHAADETLSIESDNAETPFDFAGASIDFRCIVIKSGHKPYVIKRNIGNKRKWGLSGWQMVGEVLTASFGTSKTLTALLEPTSYSGARQKFETLPSKYNKSLEKLGREKTLDAASTQTTKTQLFSSKNIVNYNKNSSWAVIIGISQYQHPEQNGLNNLIFADDDANAFARSLHNLGWTDSHIKLLTNRDATERNIKIALKSWLTKAGPDDQVILFWAGHGYADPEDPEKVYLATYDTELSIPATGYRMDEVRRALEEIGSKNVILLADTCHAGKLITRGDGNRGISIVPNIKKQNVSKGWVFMVGADTDRQAIEHTSWRNGAFTHSLIKGLNGEADGFQSAGAKDGVVTMGELKDYMKTAMPDETQKVLGVAKHPVITTSTGDPNIWNLTFQVTQ